MSKRVLILFISIIAFNLFFGAVFQLHYDEAYYWVWGQNLSLSYYDHPPMVAYLTYLSSYLGHTEFVMRLVAVATTTITIFTMYLLAQKMFTQRIADITVILALSCLLIEGMFFVTTPDNPLLMFWMLTLYTFYLWLLNNKSRYIYLSAICAGCAILSKYTAILILPGILLFLLTNRKLRSYLLKKELYLAFIITLIITMPIIIWNYKHGFASFAFQLQHGTDDSLSFNLQNLSDFIGGEVLVVSPIIFIAILYYSLRYLRTNLTDYKLAFLWWTFAFGLGFFSICSLYRHSEANWPAPVYLSALIFLAWWIDKSGKRWIYHVSLLFMIMILLIVRFPLKLLPQSLHGKVPMLNAFYGNKELLQYIKSYASSKDQLIFACDYGNASRARYYLSGYKVEVLHKARFANAYKYFDSGVTSVPKEALYFCDNEDYAAEDILHQYFNVVKLIAYVHYDYSNIKNNLYIYQANN